MSLPAFLFFIAAIVVDVAPMLWWMYCVVAAADVVTGCAAWIEFAVDVVDDVVHVVIAGAGVVVVAVNAAGLCCCC